mgnify:CR=1 FL=1
MSGCVLILVLMEDALAPEEFKKVNEHLLESLNPCFNGRCTRTEKAAIARFGVS